MGPVMARPGRPSAVAAAPRGERALPGPAPAGPACEVGPAPTRPAVLSAQFLAPIAALEPGASAAPGGSVEGALRGGRASAMTPCAPRPARRRQRRASPWKRHRPWMSRLESPGRGRVGPGLAPVGGARILGLTRAGHSFQNGGRPLSNKETLCVKSDGTWCAF